MQKAEQRAESTAKSKPPGGSKRSPKVPQIGGTGRKASTITEFPHQGPAADGVSPLSPATELTVREATALPCSEAVL